MRGAAPAGQLVERPADAGVSGGRLVVECSFRSLSTQFRVESASGQESASTQASHPRSSSTSVLPSLAGDGETLMPAASIAAILSSAPPLPPEMIAPA